MIVLYIIGLVIVSGLGLIGHAYNEKFRAVGCTIREFHKLSWPSRQVLLEYSRLPKNSRPIPNIVSTVKALDVKHGVKRSTAHFTAYSYHGVTIGWDVHPCYGNKCKMEQFQIHQAIIEIKESLNNQAHALAMAGVSGGLEDAKTLTERLREERDLINTVTKELAQ